MIIYPAVDIKNGQAVRLKKGDFDQFKVYFNDPVQAAKKWIEQGTKVLHVVDLDGAKEGRPVNTETIKRIAELDVDVQLGGGLRNFEALEIAFDLGIKRAVMGTALVKDPSLAKLACDKFGPEAIVAGVDLKDGLVAIEGWQEGAGVEYEALLDQLADVGIENLIVTDVGRDGMQTGPNIRLMEEIVNRSSAIGHGPSTGFDVIASGGVSSLEDIKRLAGIGVAGVIVGVALYEERFTLKEALEVAHAR